MGIKDVFDAADFATEYGTRIYAGHRPACGHALEILKERYARSEICGIRGTAPAA